MERLLFVLRGRLKGKKEDGRVLNEKQMWNKCGTDHRTRCGTECKTGCKRNTEQDAEGEKDEEVN